ncbi:hypothetical protein SNARM312S_07549 [Streptomyces narbonensis]
MARPLATAWSQPSPRSISGRSTATEPFRTEAVQISDCSRKSAPSNSASAMPSSKTCLPLSWRFWFSEFSMMTETAFSAPMRFGRIAQPPQPGTRPRKTSGSEKAGRAFDTVR